MSRSLRTEQGLGSRKPVQTARGGDGAKNFRRVRRQGTLQKYTRACGRRPGYLLLLREGRGLDYSQSAHSSPYREYYGHF